MFYVVKNGKTLASVRNVDDAKSKVKIFAPKKGDTIAVFDDAGNEVENAKLATPEQIEAWKLIKGDL